MKTSCKKHLVALMAAIPLFVISCFKKAPLIKQQVSLTEGRSYWFESEKTLFVFFTIRNEHGFGPNARIDLNMGRMNAADTWQDVSTVENVHWHKPAKCNKDERCQSLSIRLDRKPSSVQLRYLYHELGELSEVYPSTPLDMEQIYPGEIDSFQVYGVFDEKNQHVQWRGRHHFPGLNQEQVAAYGLIRPFATKNLYLGTSTLNSQIVNPSLFGNIRSCDGGELLSDEKTQSAEGRPVWNFASLGSDEQDYPWVCTEVSVKTGAGQWTKPAVARKNPEFLPVPDHLNLEFEQTHILRLLFSACDASHKNEEYLQFQTDRLLFDSTQEDVCIDSDLFNRAHLSTMIHDRILEERAKGHQTISLVAILHHTMTASKEAIQKELEAAFAILSLDKSQKFQGIFVYDSYAKEPSKLPNITWCPTYVGDKTSLSSCYLRAFQKKLGPLVAQSAPVFPSWKHFQGLNESQKKDARVNDIKFLAPKASDTLVSHFSTEDGTYYYFDTADQLPLQSDHALSYCAPEDDSHMLAYWDQSTSTEPTDQFPASLPALPLHQNIQPQDRNVLLGVQLSAPFFLQVDYTVKASLAPKRFKSYVAIEKKQNTLDYLGDPRFLLDRIKVTPALKRCQSFCKHPAFNDKAEYHYALDWRTEYAMACYRPTYPQPPFIGEN